MASLLLSSVSNTSRPSTTCFTLLTVRLTLRLPVGGVGKYATRSITDYPLTQPKETDLKEGVLSPVFKIGGTHQEHGVIRCHASSPRKHYQRIP